VTDALENCVKMLAASVCPETRENRMLVLKQLGLIHLDNKAGGASVMKDTPIHVGRSCERTREKGITLFQVVR